MFQKEKLCLKTRPSVKLHATICPFSQVVSFFYSRVGMAFIYIYTW